VNCCELQTTTLRKACLIAWTLGGGDHFTQLSYVIEQDAVAATQAAPAEPQLLAA
jgi:hypothetical protein